jgi:anti-sigma factor ChrR (cupin superfamily)
MDSLTSNTVGLSAVTPDIPDQALLSPQLSRYVKVKDLPWRPTRFPGIEQKILMQDPERGLLTALVRMAPGAKLPFHEHADIEQSYILEGSLVDDEGNEVGPGEYIWRPAGHRHAAWSPRGCLGFAVFLKPNIFFDTPGGSTGFNGGAVKG